jgi:hypothetical protein
MNTKRFVLASLAVFVAGMILDYLVHMVILKGAYESLAAIWRQEMNSLMWLMYVGSLIFAFLFVYIFTKGHENKGIMEGVRYGLIIGLFFILPTASGQYAMYPIPFSLAVQWFVYGLIEFIIFGIIAAIIYKPAGE